ncbi:MAG TPA: exodeoxyribonuclease V subunit alpha [Solirubrobacteraceae bacterium]|nr:exodeoxyribonuclease V subunit alpha [Solirubrobacteraceae bacterium]
MIGPESPSGSVGEALTVSRALRAPAPLDVFNRAGILTAADIHVARTLLELAGISLEGAGVDVDAGAVALGTALAVRAPRLGHVVVDLAEVARGAVPAGDLGLPEALPWPEPPAWLRALEAADTLVATGEPDPDAGADTAVGPLRPLRLVGTRLCLDRYWRQERDLAATLRGLDAQPVRRADSLSAVADLLSRFFPDPEDHAQRAAAACAALRGLSVVAGGPGTGKTTTVARTVAVLAELAARAGEPAPLIALCAPTGRAAARLAQAVLAETAPLELSPAARAALDTLGASTIHRLLGARGEGRFTHHRNNPLAHDVVIVDETSMVSLSLISRLLAAVRSDARLVLVGDPDQLSAIEAGAVLRDIVGPAAQAPCFGAGMRAILTRVTGRDPGPAAVASSFGSGVVVLRRGHRFGAPITAVASAIRDGDATAAQAALETGEGPESTVRWLDLDAAELAERPDAGRELASVVAEAFLPLLEAARAGDAAAALSRLGRLRILCAHREGRYGVRVWTRLVEEWLAAASGLSLEGEYPGRPLLLTENDYELRLFNGDSGVVVLDRESVATPVAVFDHEPGVVAVAPARLAGAQTAYASTIHKSQGSQFDTALVILPEPESRLLSRELLYTAVTRARERLLVLGSPAALAAAVARPVQRATGLSERLWGTHDGEASRRYPY